MWVLLIERRFQTPRKVPGKKHEEQAGSDVGSQEPLEASLVADHIRTAARVHDGG